MAGNKKSRKLSQGVTEQEALKIDESIRSSIPIPEDSNVLVSLVRKKIPIPAYVMLFQAIGSLLIKEIEASVFKVLWLFLCKMQYSNFIGIHQETIVEETELSLRTVQRSISKLKELNIIISMDDPQDRRNNVYIINPNAAWKGKAAERIKAIRKISPAQLALPFADDEERKEIPGNSKS